MAQGRGAGRLGWERLGRGAGIGFVVFTVLAFVVGGEPPRVGDPVAEIVSYYDGDRDQVLVSSVIFALGLGLWIWFAGTVSNYLRERGEGRVGATILAAVATFVSLQLVGTAFNAVLAYSVAGDGDAGVTQALVDLAWAVDVLAAVPSAVFFVAASLGLRRVAAIPPWLGWAGLGVAGLFVLRSTNWATDGFWSPTGEFVLVLLPCALLWILITSVVLVRAASAPREATT